MKEGGQTRPAGPEAVTWRRTGYWVSVCFKGCPAKARSMWYCKSVKPVPALPGLFGFRCSQSA
jgi:hypothetical protein